ncbi:hypothetical protein EXIGLDRAFT_632196, partial [Exidia glandulosa HHB12029]
DERLLAAARTDNEEMLQEVFDAGGYDINFQDGCARPPLDDFCMLNSGSLTVMELLLEQDGCDVDLQNRTERATPLHLALKIEEEDLRKAVVESLLDAGADTRVRNKSGAAPIDIVPANGELWTLMRKAQAEASISKDDIASGEPIYLLLRKLLIPRRVLHRRRRRRTRLWLWF